MHRSGRSAATADGSIEDCFVHQALIWSARDSRARRKLSVLWYHFLRLVVRRAPDGAQTIGFCAV